MEPLTPAALREKLIRARESCMGLADFVEKFVEATGLNSNEVINFPLLFGNQDKASVSIDGFNLNNEQMRIFNSVLGKLRNIETKPFHIFVSGPAGSGKSLLLKALRNEIQTHFNSEDSCLVTAQTVIGAKIIDGATISSTFLISFTNSIQFSPQKKDGMKNKLKKTKVLLIDGINFVDSTVFLRIDEVFRGVLDSQKPFGGVSVVVFGDLFQVQPINGSLIYEEPKSKRLWNLMKLEELHKNEKVTDPEESEMFEILRCGGSFLTQAVVDYLKKNCRLDGDSTEDVIKKLENMKMTHIDKSFAVIAYENEMVQTVNSKILENLGNVKPLAAKENVYNLKGPNEKYPFPGEKENKRLLLAVGSQVMLTTNIKFHLLGEIGRVVEISDDIVTVRFPSGTAQISRFGWYHGEAGWKQFPLIIAEAFTLHKGQGISFDGVIVVGTRNEHQIYTGFSRAKSLKLCSIPANALDDLPKRNLNKEKEELKRMRAIVSDN